MNIGIDIDDTISLTYEETFPRALDFVKNVLKKNIEPDLVTGFEHNYIENVFELNEEETNAFWKENLEKIIKIVKPKKDAVDVINKLKQEGHNIIIITARWDRDYINSKQLSIEWLKKNNIKYDKIFTNMDSKKEIAINEKIDLFIDDSIPNCRAVSEAGIKCFLFKSIVNSKLEDSKKFDIVKSWDEIYKRINEGRI